MSAALNWLDRYFVSQPVHVAYEMPTNANQTLPSDVYDHPAPMVTVDVTSAVTITVTRDLFIPLDIENVFSFRNKTTGTASIRIIGKTGTGITIGNGESAIVRADGTNVVSAEAPAGSIADDSVTNAKLAECAALTVKGNATNATANPTDIAFGTDHFVLRRSGTALGTGLLVNANLDPAAAIAWSKMASTPLAVADDGSGGPNIYGPATKDVTVRAGGASGATKMILSDSGTYFQVVVAAGAYLDADTVYMRTAAGTNRHIFSSTSISIGVPAVSFVATASAPTISQATRTTDAAPQDLGITAQSPWASATGANRKPGNVVFTVGSPTNGGTTHGKHSFVVAGSERMSCDNATFALAVSAVTATCDGWTTLQVTANNIVKSKQFPKVRGTSGGTLVIASGTARDNCHSLIDATVIVIAEGSTDHATFRLRMSLGRNTGSIAVSKDGADSVLESFGSAASDAVPAGWSCVIDDNGNDWEVKLTLPAVNAQAVPTVQVTEATNVNTP